MLPDTHMHTSLCKHADGEAVDYARAAEAKEIPEICFTEHCPTPGDAFDLESRMNMADFPTYTDWVRRAQATDSVKVLYGIEADYYPGCEPFLETWLPAQPFDLVMGSVHYIRDWGFDNPAYLAEWDRVQVKDVWAEYFDLLGQLADTGFFDVVGHLDVVKKFGHVIPEPDLRELAAPTMDRIAASGMAMELSTAGLRKPVGEIYPSAPLVAMARERDIPICFGSDAHSPGDVGYAFDEALRMARDAGYEHYVRYRRRQRHFVPLPET